MRDGGSNFNGASLGAADLDAIVKDIAVLKKDFGSLVEHVKSGTAETVNGEVRRIYGSLAAHGERSAAAIAQQVEERPFASLLLAFAVGFVGGRLLIR
jgi:ElaB/YqjD/DUF883 family membrane-anchored ribosome-binding protein